jgi:uncharacterized membrane protein
MKYLNRYLPKRLLKCERASFIFVVPLIVTVVVLIIGVYLLATLETAMPTLEENSAGANMTDSIFAISWNAYGLAVIIPIIVVAGVIIGYLIMGFNPR